MGNRPFLLAALLAIAPAGPASAQYFSLFADHDVPVFCGNYSGLSWVTTVGTARAPDTDDPNVYREMIGRAAGDALRAQGHRVDALPTCFFDDPALPRTSFNRPVDQLHTQQQEESRTFGGARAVARLDVPEPVDALTRPRAVPLPGARLRRMVAGAAPPPAAGGAGTRIVLAPATATAMLPAGAAPADNEESVRALNDVILARHRADAEAERRQAEAFAEERRRHQQVVDAAAERERLYRQEVARLQGEEAAHQAAEAQYQREYAAYQAQLRGRRPSQPPPAPPTQPVRTPSVQQAAAVDWREAVTVCAFDTAEAQARPGHWRCVGPALANLAKVGTDVGELDPTVLGHLGAACGSGPDAIRDLGSVRAYRVFGCGFGLNPVGNLAQVDAAARFGLAEIPGRNVYRCPPGQAACRTR